jgi:hypothetical protein
MKWKNKKTVHFRKSHHSRTLDQPEEPRKKKNHGKWNLTIRGSLITTIHRPANCTMATKVQTSFSPNVQWLRKLQTISHEIWISREFGRRRWCGTSQIFHHCLRRSSSKLVLTATTALGLQLGRPKDKIHASISDVPWHNSWVIRPV